MTSMSERTHFFIKIYLSHFILERVDAGCVWEMRWRWGQTVILTQNSSHDHSSISSSSWLGLLNRGSLKAAKPSVCELFSRWHLQLTQIAPSTWLYNCITSICFHCSSAYLHRGISWLTARSRVNMFHEYLIYFVFLKIAGAMEYFG